MDKVLEQAEKDITRILGAYQDWSSKMQPGKVSYSTYYDLIEFVNSRMETVDSCRILLGAGRIADSLGLCRSLLENYLLFILMCRGTKYFRLVTFKGKNEAEITKAINKAKKDIGNGSLVAIEKHPTLPKHYLYIYQGIKSSDVPDYYIPYHYFGFQEFSPETMRLDDENYFTYYDRDEALNDKRKQFKKEQGFIYRHYLSYDALLNCLRINDIADKGAVGRIEAHYTFLGKFLHPTKDTFRDLRERSNYHTGDTFVGFEYPYEKVATLLGYVYVIHTAIGLLQEMADVLDKAPKDYLTNSGSDEVRALINELSKRYNYFWYIFNEPSDYDKFEYCIHYLNDEQFKAIDNDYHKVDSSTVTFEKDIYRRFVGAMGGWSNRRVGSYSPPYISN